MTREGLLTLVKVITQLLDEVDHLRAQLAGREEREGASATRKDAEPPAGGESPMAPGADRTPEGGTCASSSPPPAALPKEAKP